ncbi:MAG TPA: serine/threonine-protein kinase [Vicinamibacterales bacterium]|nr:serine/threonine-protein kinase [Vicinamibacterales bacterium]
MTWVSDEAIDRLRGLDDRPDFAGTRYELFEELGRGGMGIVFRGRDRALDRDVAIKVTAWSTAADADRLRREARTLASLEHPGIVPVHDVGQLADGRVYSVMQLVRGERLDASARALSLPDRLRLFDRICDTVSFAHARDVVHRDLKPANIMVGPFGQVLLLDWGLARPGSSLAGGAAEGTDGYMAPEQRTGVADTRSDVYALGAILRDLIGAADAGARATRPLASIVARAMGPSPAARYPTVTALAADVRRFVDGDAVTAHRETLLDRAQRFAWAYRTPIGLVLAYLAMRILLLLWRG